MVASDTMEIGPHEGSTTNTRQYLRGMIVWRFNIDLQRQSMEARVSISFSIRQRSVPVHPVVLMLDVMSISQRDIDALKLSYDGNFYICNHYDHLPGVKFYLYKHHLTYFADVKRNSCPKVCGKYTVNYHYVFRKSSET
jgi:hypothetical protein